MSDLVLPRVPRFPIEEGHIKLFARALGDGNPIYADLDYAGRSPLGGVIAPPTFSEAANHFDEDWPFRPRFGQPWFGSSASPSGVPAASNGGGTAMHAETHFTYHRPLRPGMVLSVRPRRGRRWEKYGPRSGKLTFSEVVSTFVDGQGAPVLDCATVALRTERIVEETVGAPATAKPQATAPKTLPVALLDRDNCKVGLRTEATLVENLTRTQIIQYAGVSGDFSPQHTDEVFNTQVAGYPTIFAHGMLTMGMLGRALTDFVGDGRLKTFGFQFRRQVWPGDSLFAALEVTATGEGPQPIATLALSVSNQHGQLVGKGYATTLVS
ncbi:MaoC/PaaZ C-terminal domain-containing protein [Mesorhizobium sp. IMUNJ 23232]|uniref:MaoC/PaaZ C-terminal domain-containing protein n=1 Tax=Mesorhizobium sp. IMUNJ 23232 TaxID=3376064 RepID=UPI0037BD2D43